MFGQYAEVASAMAKARIQATCCTGNLKEWCRVECRTVPRYG